MGRIEREASEGKAANEIAQNGRDLVPDQVVRNREIAAKHQTRREQEHIHDRVLEGHEEEHHDRHPHGDDFARNRGRDHRADDAGRDHPVAEHTANEKREHSCCAMGGVTYRARFADAADFLANGIRLNREAKGENNGHHHGHSQRAEEVADEDEEPIAQGRRTG